jgi:hypothetical protein
VPGTGVPFILKAEGGIGGPPLFPLGTGELAPAPFLSLCPPYGGDKNKDREGGKQLWGEGMARPRSTDRSGRALSLYPFLWEKLRESARAREKKKLSLCKGKLKKYVYGG